MNKRGLFLLTTDNMNLSLVKIYRAMIEREYQIDCYAVHDNALALHSFSGYKVNYIKKLDLSILNTYDFVFCGRNCFEFEGSEILIDYQGVIYTDDTAFYEGKNVYGDVIFVNGESNLRNISPLLKVEKYLVECVKAEQKTDAQVQRDFWKAYEKYQTKVLYIESGHFPFGKKGRTILAQSFAETVKTHPEYMFVVKPRFLLGEGHLSKHSNEDYLLHYVEKCFAGRLPDNLLWLHSFHSLEELIPGADIILHTYSSAHSEAVLHHKKLINIVNVPSEETADFRRNRLQMVEHVIDQAGCNVDVEALDCCLTEAKRADTWYEQYINGGKVQPVNEILEIIEYGSFLYREEWKVWRLLGYFRKQLTHLENRFDEYQYFEEKLKNEVSYFLENYRDTKRCMIYIREKIVEWVYEYLERQWEDICENVFDRAYTMRFLMEQQDYSTLERMLKTAYGKNEKDAAWYYVQAIISQKSGNDARALEYAKQYIAYRNGKKFEKTDAENDRYEQEMRYIIGKD